ncbi:hypothetical protein E5Q_06360 [Mixia osmundae IAM 14324]|uniref:CDC20/Fizzy WD40 domain-containing protein n=1 Tax=Mixia osmundae (strain CBS 9802 / IAM 14324 / JCM 22182 / KY 12970) TaxID=764103 RepID=G7E939_MIXOS|nr:hypothetical protein E5Q_06360 [Mixia osmundae IAM 14324]
MALPRSGSQASLSDWQRTAQSRNNSTTSLPLASTSTAHLAPSLSPAMPSLYHSASTGHISRSAEPKSTFFGQTNGSAASSRQPSPSSPRKGKDRERTYGDRFIPTRDGVDLATSYQLLDPDEIRSGPTTPTRRGKRTIDRAGAESDVQKDEADRTFDALLKSELFDASPHRRVTSSTSQTSLNFISQPGSPTASRYSLASHSSAHSLASLTNSPLAPSGTTNVSPSRNLFSFTSPSKKRSASQYAGLQGLDSPTHDRYSTSPIKYESQKLLLSPKKVARSLSKVPFKVLDAPELADDFYLNLVDWSSTNILGVGLGSCVYLWQAHTSKVERLCDLSEQGDHVTSINWIGKGSQIAIGTYLGTVQIWDAETGKQPIRTMSGHTGRVGALAWNNHILSSGSRDRNILHRDVRSPAHWNSILSDHKQEVCGLKWNTAENQLASGGNDNKLFVWDALNTTPLHRFAEHTAAVKAIAWNPHQHGILASGGGTADKKIRFWNTLTGSLVNEVDTGSQVCNLMFSRNNQELVSTHGFSSGKVQNQVCVWKYPSMTQVATLTGHSLRVLYLAMSPDGQTIVTGAGDETLRFWNAFPKSKTEKKNDASLLNPFSKVR